MQVHDHRLVGVPFIPSPNCSDRPADESPSLLVIHNISLPPGQFGGPGIVQLFTNCLNPDEHPYYAGIADLRVSAHLLIRRDGTLLQFVPFDRKAWHAGQSCYQGREACNDFSIGIEMEGCDDQPFTDSQYDSLVGVSRTLLEAYPRMQAEAVVGHSDISPGRKTDPGPCFDWGRYRRALNTA